ncbi:phosphotransferase [Nonomuraea ferruginea]|uniref:Phosphotransferase n=1 Tax=Nonomuraea ferruginea TaxID=46174 RepID=A0ABT4TC36_9ACTN|nr:phosphotransferase [Nonomuraea ferruginea]MDA0647106.1 phosphotransferase [Nonomuraea ferruginea]
MEDLPDGFGEADLVAALRAFGVAAEQVAYAPVGFGDYHWTVLDTGGRRWFATVSDPARKEHGLPGLRRAMETAAVLRERDGLEFVVAPVRSRGGDPVMAAGSRYAVTVFPWEAGMSGHFGQEQTPEERDRLLALLADLHGRVPPETTPVAVLDVPGRDRLVESLADPGGDGPFSAEAGVLLRKHAGAVLERLAEFDKLAGRVRGRGDGLVVTHGEPHPGNLIRRDDGRLLLVDWDTVGLAVPERDLAVVSPDPAALDAYVRATGRQVDVAAIALYRLRWALADVADFAVLLCGPHTRTPDTETARRGLAWTVERLAEGPWSP